MCHYEKHARCKPAGTFVDHILHASAISWIVLIRGTVELTVVCPCRLVIDQEHMQRSIFLDKGGVHYIFRGLARESSLLDSTHVYPRRL